ncbi:MAG: hypothetical protein IPM23_08380 [Candidatus Melainabacteria bacterium]|nr:hypothetical protein [Candidatus Melainabacteria bacterium]
MKTRKIFTLAVLTGILAAAPGHPAQGQTTTLLGSVETRAVTGEPASPLKLIQPVPDKLPAPARQPAPATRTVVQKVVVKERDTRTYFQKHPKIKAAAVGAGVGAGAGALTGLVARRGIIRGAAIGAGTGAGVGLIRSSRTLERHPIARDVATGATAGLGFGAAASRRVISKTTGKTAAVGAAVGLGYGLFKHLK